MRNDTKGYVFPDDWNPGVETYCFRVYVPKRLQYLAAFWGAYEFFGTWLAWMRDPLKRGKDVANVWRSAINQARLEFELTGGECMPTVTGIRSNPLDPCDIQEQLDGGSWVHAFYIGDCAKVGPQESGALRFNGTTLQQYDPCTGEWHDIGPATDPAQTVPEAGKYPGKECGNGIAAANLARMIEDGKNKMCDFVGTGATKAQAALVAFEAIGKIILSLTVFDIAIAFLIEVWAYLSAHYTEAAAFDLYAALSPILPAYFQPDGSITQAQYDALVARLQAITDSYAIDTAEHTDYGYALSWVQAAGPAGVVKMSDGAFIDTFDCSSSEWEVVFDFVVSRQGFSVSVAEGADTRGAWSGGQGWLSTFFHVGGTPGEDYHSLEILRGFPSCHLIYAKLEGDCVAGFLQSGTLPNLSLITDGDYVHPLISLTTGGTGLVGEWTTGGDFDNLWIGNLNGYRSPGTNVDPGGTGVVRKLTLRGTGFNPFA